MAGIFLSYDREDSAVARIVATALEDSGHSVWWDLHVRGGAQFSKVIEEALKAADVVVVLWSKRSIDSAWVRDEAAAGRDRNCLVPATIDGTEAPLGFRQFQTIDLKDWKRGSKGRGYPQLEAAINELVPAGAPERKAEERRPAWRPSPVIATIAGIALTAALAAGAYFLWPSASVSVPTVTVEPASSSAMSQALSRDLLAKLGVLQTSNGETLQLVDQGGSKTSDLIFKVEGSSEGGATKATLLLLSGRNYALLWSGDFDQPSNKLSDLKQQLAYSAANVLGCATEAYGPGGSSLDDKTRRLFFKGCGDFTQAADADRESLLRIFREVVRRAPRFEGAWTRLLTIEAELITTPPFTHDTPAMRARLRADLAAARKVNPDLPEADIAEADSIASDNLEGAIRLLDRATEKNPDSAIALGNRSTSLMQVGRLEEAVNDARRAVQLEPFSSRAQESNISVLTYAGKFDEARRELAKADTLFPGATNFAEARYRLNLRYGSPQEALDWLNQGNGQTAFPSQLLFLKARIDPTKANVDAAVEASRRGLDGTGLRSADYIQVLGAFGRTEELIQYLLSLPENERGNLFAGVLFRPAFKDFWRDPRSMQVARRFGILKYWRSSGKWPDFCADPDLPYDCKKEAAKLGA